MRNVSPPQTHRLTTRRTQRSKWTHSACDESGLALIELLIAAVLTIVVVAAAGALLVVARNSESRNQTYAEQVESTQSALSTLLHDLRGATAITSVGPGLISFQIAQNGTTYNVQYDCTATDSLGSPYTRCARTQAVAPALPPLPGSKPLASDIQHVYNNPLNTAAGPFATFCNTAGSAASGSVFFVSNSTVANNDGSGLACDEAYEDIVAAHPIYVTVRVQVPAAGGTPTPGLSHFTVLQGGAFLPNLDAGS